MGLLDGMLWQANLHERVGRRYLSFGMVLMDVWLYEYTGVFFGHLAVRAALGLVGWRELFWFCFFFSEKFLLD